MLMNKEIEIQNIDHLGIVAGIIDAIGLVEIINELIPEEKGEKVSSGQVVKAMILNGLGFVSQPLYMFPINQEFHISNWNEHRDFILNLLPDDCLLYYKLST